MANNSCTSNLLSTISEVENNSEMPALTEEELNKMLEVHDALIDRMPKIARVLQQPSVSDFEELMEKGYEIITWPYSRDGDDPAVTQLMSENGIIYPYITDDCIDISNVFVKCDKKYLA